MKIIWLNFRNEWTLIKDEWRHWDNNWAKKKWMDWDKCVSKWLFVPFVPKSQTSCLYMVCPVFTVYSMNELVSGLGSPGLHSLSEHLCQTNDCKFVSIKTFFKLFIIEINPKKRFVWIVWSSGVLRVWVNSRDVIGTDQWVLNAMLWVRVWQLIVS